MILVNACLETHFDERQDTYSSRTASMLQAKEMNKAYL